MVPEWFTPAVSVVSVCVSSMVLYGAIRYEIGKIKSRTDESLKRLSRLESSLDQHYNAHISQLICPVNTKPIVFK